MTFAPPSSHPHRFRLARPPALSAAQPDLAVLGRQHRCSAGAVAGHVPPVTLSLRCAGAARWC
ncbi:MAG: hypothetical protein MZV49_02270 [Rhodopseudomonas palustris]|nr:hypothetical protein [Rhodopseudomonas palustris]